MIWSWASFALGIVAGVIILAGLLFFGVSTD